jgi:hypothetical protein
LSPTATAPAVSRKFIAPDAALAQGVLEYMVAYYRCKQAGAALEQRRDAARAAVAAERARIDDEAAAKRSKIAVHSTAAGGVMRAHVPLPSEDDMRALLLARRKQALLDKERAQGRLL